MTISVISNKTFVNFHGKMLRSHNMVKFNYKLQPKGMTTLYFVFV